MQVSLELQQRVEQRITDDIDKIKQHFNITLDFPNIIYTKRGSVAGTANSLIWEININPVLFNQNVDAFINSTVPHELAHLAQSVIYPNINNVRRKRSIHGKQWKHIMSILNADSSRCHQFDTSNVTTRKPTISYQCQGCQKQLNMGIIRHKRQQQHIAQHGKGKYHHTSCGITHGQLKLITQPSLDHSHNPAQRKTIEKKQTTINIITTKKELAAQIFQLTNKRATFINNCIEQIGMKKSTASTYHHNFNSGLWTS